jgi:ABC-type nickel/cobalt efflux system permease component RcnA
MKRSKDYSVIASRRRLTLLKYAGLGLVLAVACVSSIPLIFRDYDRTDSYLTTIAAVIFAGVGLWLFVKFVIQAVSNVLLAGDAKHLYFKKRLLPWTQIEQFLFTEEEINGKKVTFVTVAFERIPVNADFTFSRDKQPVVSGPVVTSHPKKDTIYRIRLDDIEQPVEVVEQLLYQYLDKYGKK